jgi:hypothetical protein
MLNPTVKTIQLATGPCKMLVLICSCQATPDRRDACRETWLAHGLPNGMEAVFLVGRPGVPCALAGDTLYLDCDDSYVGLPQKMHRAYNEALARWDFDWLFKTDDDSWVNLLRVMAYPRTRDYMGRPVALHGEDPTWHRTVVPKKELVGVYNYAALDSLKANGQGWNGPWASGMGYFLSRHAVQLVAREPWSHVLRELYEDKFVGDVMGSYGIYLHGQHATLRDSIKPDWSNIFGATALHPCPPKVMREVYWRLHRAGEIGT